MDISILEWFDSILSFIENSNMSLIMIGVAIFFSTLINEDITCISAAFLVSNETISIEVAIIACSAGILTGDTILYLIGKYCRPLIKRGLLQRVIREESIQNKQRWFNEKGTKVIFISRFLPGTRVFTYVTAGFLNLPYRIFISYLFVGVIIWVPIIVGLATKLGTEIYPIISTYNKFALPSFILSVIGIYIIQKLLVSILSYRGRRLWVYRVRKIVRWEFWPVWFFYIPTCIYIISLMIKYRSIRLISVTNPCMECSGLVNESKSRILTDLKLASAPIAEFMTIFPEEPKSKRQEKVTKFMNAHKLSFPIVLKPDKGERGRNVHIIEEKEQLARELSRQTETYIVQKYIEGIEYGIFYYRYPNKKKGHLLSINKKDFPKLYGDGKTSLERLILRDNHAVSMAPVFLTQHEAHLHRIPSKDVPIELVKIGTHARGSVFSDASHTITKALTATFDTISRNMPGFFFGRFDVRVKNEKDLKAGKNVIILELNGVTSETTNIYDAKYNIFDAYEKLFKQWRIAFEIAKINASYGHTLSSWGDIKNRIFAYIKRL